jgi:DNA-binding Xre family transcriptional regulator
MGGFKIQVRELAKKRGVTELYKFLVDNGVSSHHATELRQGRLRRLDLDLLKKLCIIFRCPIQELIVYEPTVEKELEYWPFLSSMLVQDTGVDIGAKLKSMDSEKLKRLEEFIAGL